MIALNILHAENEKIFPAYFSKCNSNCEKHIILLMNPKGEGWFYIVVKTLSALLRGITSKHDGNFFV